MEVDLDAIIYSECYSPRDWKHGYYAIKLRWRKLQRYLYRELSIHHKTGGQQAVSIVLRSREHLRTIQLHIAASMTSRANHRTTQNSNCPWKSNRGPVETLTRPIAAKQCVACAAKKKEKSQVDFVGLHIRNSFWRSERRLALSPAWMMAENRWKWIWGLQRHF